MSLRRSHWLLFLLLLAGIPLLVSCHGSHSHRSLSILVHKAPAFPRATITIPRGQMLFTPFILVIQPGTRVTWQNEDTVVHNVVTTGSNALLNPQAVRLSVPAGKTIAFAFTRPGLYNYFDPTQASWNGTDQRASAYKGVPNYPLAMEGIIWVQGPIAGLPPSGTVTIPGRDDFSPNFLALPRGGVVTWRNADRDEHIVALVPGWQTPINPVNFGPLILKGASARPDERTQHVTLATPGLYYYYCPVHASIHSAWKRAQAHKDASEAPLSMEGFLLVIEHP